MAHPFGAQESKAYAFAWLQVATALVKLQDIHYGYWKVGASFRTDVMQVKGGDVVCPAVVCAVPGLALTRVDLPEGKAPDDSTVDAAIVNPRFHTAGVS